MNRIIISLTREGDHRIYDLELPVDIVSSQLCYFLSTALKWSTAVTTEDLTLQAAEQSGRSLRPDETLAEAGLWDGTRLILKGAYNPSAQPVSKNPLVNEQNPVTGWRPIFPSGLPSKGPSPDPTSIDFADSHDTSIDRGGPVIGWVQS